MKICSSKADLLIHSTLCCTCVVDTRKGVRGHLINAVPVLAQQLQLWLHLHAWPYWYLNQLLWHQYLRQFSIVSSPSKSSRTSFKGLKKISVVSLPLPADASQMIFRKIYFCAF